MLWILDPTPFGRRFDAVGGASVYRHVLIVEDEQPLRRLIARNLVGRGHAVREAATADEGFAAVREELPDLILLDINLPDRTGWDLLRELRARGISVPTIVVSAVNVSPSRLAEFHPLAHLPKPFPLDSLLRLVRGDEPERPAENVSGGSES
jgi:DNA-binding response OmpR family regulator